MTLRFQTFLTGLLALLAAALLALTPASANPASGGYQLFVPAASEHQHDIQLASLGNFDYFAKIASECCNATNNILTTNIPTSGRKFNQLTSRGWDQSSIDNVVNGPAHTSTATNRATGNPATAYFDSSGNYVVRDNVTGDLVQMSNRNDPNWIPDPSITDPYIP